LPAHSNLLQWLPAVSQAERTTNATGVRIRLGDQPAVAWSDTKILLQYRRGDFADPLRERFLPDNSPRLASFSLIQAMAFWQLKDYWGAMMIATKGYALVQSGARHGLVAISVQPDIFPGMSEPEYLQAPWYDWAVADLLTREWSQMVFEAEQSVGRAPASGTELEQVALLRAAGEWHALRGEWADALRCFQYCLQHNQKDSLDHTTMDYQNAAVACLKLRDEPGYLRVREEMATRFRDLDQKKVAARTLNVSIMRSLDDQTTARLQPFADRLRDTLQKQTGGYDAESALRLALFEFRRGNFTNAIDSARRSAASVSGVALPNAMIHVISAMSLHHLGNHSAVPLELAQAKNLTETGFDLEFDMWHWRDWILLRFLLQEADSLTTQPPPGERGSAPR